MSDKDYRFTKKEIPLVWFIGNGLYRGYVTSVSRLTYFQQTTRVRAISAICLSIAAYVTTEQQYSISEQRYKIS
jgi:hypothetical protein